MNKNSSNKQKILFVCHWANYSGAPLILLGIIREFSKLSEIPFEILLIRDGELRKEFEAIGKTFLWKGGHTYEKDPSPLRNNWKRVMRRIHYRRMKNRLRKFSLIFYNTIANGDIQLVLSGLQAKRVCYVHELEASIHMLTNRITRKEIFNGRSHFLAGSKAVKKNLVDKHEVRENSVSVVYSSIDKVSRNRNEFAGFAAEFRKQHAIREEAIIIGVPSTSEWRKGFDLFLPLIETYFEIFPNSNVYFVWKGMNDDIVTRYRTSYDLEKSRYGKRVIVLPHGNDSIEHISIFDIHLLLSREDPYPLVVLEAASFGIPTVCFDDAGGAVEFIEEDCGLTAPYGNLIQMAKKLNDLVVNPDTRRCMGEKAKEKVKSRHSHKKATLQVIDILKKVDADISIPYLP